MQTSRGLVSSQPGRLEALRARHAAIDERIQEEQKSPAMSDTLLRRLKAEKLMLKDEIQDEASKKQAG